MRKQNKGVLRLSALLVLFSFAISYSHAAPDPKKGKAIFDATCTACHKIGAKLIGPDLTGVTKRWNGDMKKMTAYIHNPTKFFTTDPYVEKIVKEANGVLMAGQPQLSDDDVADVIAYVNDPSAMSAAPVAAGATASAGGASSDAVAHAKEGKKIFDNTCTACHKIGGKLIGPALEGVKKRWGGDMTKLTAYIHNPAKFFTTDAYVEKLVKDANGVLMAGQPQLSDQQVADVIEYVNDPSILNGGGTAAGTSGDAYMPVPSDNSLLKYLFIGALILVLIIFYITSRIFNNFSKNNDDDDGFDGPNKGITLQKINSVMMILFFIAFIGGLLYECSIHLTPQYMLPPAASNIGVQIERLFFNTIVVTSIVFFITQTLLFYYSFKYRRKVGRKALFYSHNNTIEIIWTTIPAIVLSYLVLDGFRVWREANSRPDNHPFVVEAFAKQFQWAFRYPGPDGKLGRTDFRKISADNPLGIDFDDPASKDDFVAKELHLPDNQPVELDLRSQDVIHDAYLPQFRMQLYAQPGMHNSMRFTPIFTTEEMRAKTANEKFEYELACNQLCGAGHYNMRAIIKVETDQDLKKWESTFKPAYADYQGSKSQLSASLK